MLTSKDIQREMARYRSPWSAWSTAPRSDNRGAGGLVLLDGEADFGQTILTELHFLEDVEHTSVKVVPSRPAPSRRIVALIFAGSTASVLSTNSVSVRLVKCVRK